MEDQVLFVDDDPEQCGLVELALSKAGFRVKTTTSAYEALSLVASAAFDIVVTDLDMAEMNGLDLCERILGTQPNMVVIVVAGRASMATAIEAMHVGALDFLVKPLDQELLTLAVARAVTHRRLSDEVRLLKEKSPPARPANLVGLSDAMNRVYDLAYRVAGSDATVLIQGETGTGKELIARAVHSLGPRSDGPFVAINCAAVPAPLLESELFGHTRGAFTDAKAAHVGLFVQAEAGTVFLDEISEMPLEIQPKLLRALQERKVRPIGANLEVPFDARLITATNRDLELAITEKRFRDDLYYRINVVKIVLPPLRDRGNDVLKLASHFLDRYAGLKSPNKKVTLSPDAAERLVDYNWPGNVRELENCIERAVALSRFDRIVADDLPQRIRTHRTDRISSGAGEPAEIVTMDELERRHVLRVLKLVGGNKSRAAQILGLDRRTLYRRLERYGGANKAA